MENKSVLMLLHVLLLLTTLTTTNAEPTISASATPATAVEQVNNIMDALVGAGGGDFSTWVSILSMANPTVIPLSATLFIPQDNTLLRRRRSHPDPFLFPYHVVPQRLSFSDLLLLPSATRLPTLLPSKTISVTDNSPANFSLDGSPLTLPDLYSTPSVAVHALADVLDYSLFGDGIPSRSAAAASSSSSSSSCHVLFLIFFSCFPFLLQQLLFG